MIEFREVTKVYNPDTVALKNVSFKVERGEVAIVAGRSGAGKTTLLRLVLAEERPSEGEILVNEKEIHNISSKELPYYRRNIGAIFQDYKLIPQKTVYENVGFVLKAIGATDEEIEASVPQVLNIVGLSGKEGKFPKELSSGEKQRAGIARALIHKPEIVLADEPTGNLDPANTREIIDLMQKINEFGTTILIATHSREIIRRLKARTLLLEGGEVKMEADSGKVLI